MSERATEPDFEEVLARALELRDAERKDWLDAACGDRPDLRAAVLSFAEQAAKHAHVFQASLTHDGSVGDLLGARYRLEQRLGAGAMGVVYRARDLELERDVAVKVLRTDMVDPEEATSRFLREAEAMARIQHPAIVTVYDRGHASGGRPYIVMELLDGKPLSDLLDEGRRRASAAFSDDARWLGELIELKGLDQESYLRLVTRWVAELAAGLEAVHRAGVLHRDIKPSNIFLRRDGRPVLLDFGVALREDHGTLTREGASVGTPVYMAPESLRPGSKARPAVDVYGLTATLYHMLTLRPPYTGSATQVLAAIPARDPPPASRLRPGLPRDLQAILDKGMERSPLARYASAAELERDLRAFLDYRPIAARPISPLRRAARRLGRSKLMQGISLAALAVALALGARAVRGSYLEQRSEGYAAVARQLPPNFTVVLPANRRFRYEADRDRVAALLDRAVDLCSDPLPSYLLRSSFRLDQGDLAGATLDMAVVARHVDTPLAGELLARYERIQPEELPVVSIPLDDLPAVAADLDVYLLAYHRMRSGEQALARELLADPRIAGIAHAQELRLAAADFEGLSAAEEKERASHLLSEAIRLEERVGYRTAGTAHVIARMASVAGRYVEALEAAREGIALADRSHALRITAGMMAERLGLDDEAKLHYAVAIDLQPDYFKSYRNLMWLHLDRGELDEVEMLIERAPFGEGDQAEQTRLAYRARVETERAMRAQDAGDRATSVEHAERAASLLLRSRELGPLTPDAYVTINAALLADEPQAVFAGLAGLLAKDPLRWRRLELLLDSMPDDLDGGSTKALRAFLEALYDDLASQQELVEGSR